MPAISRSMTWPLEIKKKVSKAKWIFSDGFAAFQRSGTIDIERAVADDPIVENVALHNSISRNSGTVSGGGRLFSQSEWSLRPGFDTLDIYARIQPEWPERLLDLFHLLARDGFGADASTGRGEFEVIGGFEPADELDGIEPAASAFVVLSTFQPGRHDPTDGMWEAFTKYGKLGTGYGLENVFKRPTIMLKPGAVFRGVSRPFVGRAIQADELLAPDVVGTLEAQGVRPAQLAFGLAVPAVLASTEFGPELAY